MSNCLDNIIGLSQTTCDCLDPKPTGYNVSASGIYLDQLEGFNIDLAAAADDCARDGIWARMERARRNAIFDYKNNLLGCIGTNYKPRIDPLGVQLGESTYQGSLNVTQAFAGLKIFPMQIKGGVMILKRIGVIVSATVPVTVRVYNNIPSNGNNSTLIFQSPLINATANTITWASLSTPLELPMWNYQKQVRYYVVFVMDGTFQPKDNRKDCGCGGTAKPYAQWLDLEGTVGDDINNPDTFTATTSANGLSLDMLIKCRTADIICSDENPLDFADDGYAMNVAYAIRFRTGARLYEELLSTGKINRFTLLNREYIEAKKNEWNSEYMNWINYLCANTEMSRNECLICRTTQTSLIRTHMGVTGEQFNWLHDVGCINC